MRFTNPWFLLLLAPLVLGLAATMRQVHGIARARKRIAFSVRFILGACLILALAGPEIRRPNEGVCTVFVLDRSDSIGEADRQRSDAFVGAALLRLGPKDLGGVVAFGKNALIDSAPAGRRPLERVLSTVDGSATDLAGAIRLASATFPEGKARRIVVLSDGNETSGDAIEAAQVAATDGVQIDYVSLGLDTSRAEVSVVALESPNQSRVDQPFDVRVVVDSTHEQDATMDIDRDGVLIKSIRTHLPSGRSSIVFPDKLADSGFHRYRATIRAPYDTDARNNVGLAYVSVKGKPRILVMQQKQQSNAFTDAIAKNGISADIVGPDSIPSKPEALQVYDAIVLNDFNASNFVLDQMKLIQSAVRDSGLGFAMIGGENSFLPGGYYGSPIAEMLPVDLNIRQRKTFASASLCIMIDTSGSMGMIEDGVPKVRLAAKAAEETVKLLSPLDRVGVAGSTDGIVFVAPMQQVLNKPAIIEEIEKLSVGGGGIYVEPTCDRAEQALNAETTKIRHFLLLADGDDCDTQQGSIAIVSRMRAHQITTTAVAIGDGKDVGFLRNLAAAGGGKFFLAKHANQLPAIFTQDAAVMARTAIEEGAFYPKMSPGEEVLKGIESTPPLLAYCLTDRRPLATMSMSTAKDDPLLAHWQYGLGTSLAFTSDSQPRWSAHWIGWPGFGAFWSQAMRAVSRRATLNDYQVSVQNEGAKGLIEVKAYDRLGNPMAATTATVRVSAPGGQFKEIELSQQAPGDYRAAFDASELGTYLVTVAEPDPTGGVRTQASGFSIAYPAEYRSYRANEPLLQRVSKITGGLALSSPAQALRQVPDPGASISELWPALLLIAAILLPFDVGVRRVALPLAEILAKSWAWIRFRFRGTHVEVAAQQSMVGRLNSAKRRSETPSGEREPAPVIAPMPTESKASATADAPSKPGVSAAQTLLDAKRKREGK